MPTILRTVKATAGYLERAPITFSPGLNCIIGARGTCKSTLIESIRFAFNADPERVKILLGQPIEQRQEIGLLGIVSVTLEGGSIRCEALDLADNTQYIIERDIQSEPRIYREGVKDHTDTSLLHQIEIYSQGDLQRIAENEYLRLKLIDRPYLAVIEGIRKEQNVIAQKLKEIGPKIRANKNRADQLRVQIRALPELQSHLNQVCSSRPTLSKELDELRALYIKRKAAMSVFDTIIQEFGAASDVFLNSEDHVANIEVNLAQIEQHELPEMLPVQQSVSEVHKKLTRVLSLVKELQGIPLLDIYQDLAQQIEQLNEPYYELRKREAEANESLKVEDELKRQIDHLDREKKELIAIEESLQSLIGERAILRQKLRKLGDEIFQLREREVSAINEMHGHIVVLTLDHDCLSSAYSEQVQRLLQGSRLRGQDEIAKEISAKLTPEDLVDLVEAGETNKLATILGREQTQMTRLMSFLIDSPGLYELEGNIFEDRLNIILFDEGQPKPVQTLSKGQKATALLPLILREAPYPLIFDQPEDDLDNRFIFNSLVRTIRDLKEHRQIIFVTHNANIPVIGEAESVIVMQMDTPKRAAPPVIGNVDERQQEIVDLLEGGAEAFKERQRRYKELLTPKTRRNAE